MIKKDNNAGTALIILNAVNNIRVGKHKLACFLKGSRSKSINPISQQQTYGGLLWHDISTIEGFIEQLEAMELIRRTNISSSYHPYAYSVYVLTDAGKKAVEEKIDVPLQTVKQKKKIIVGDSEKITLSMLKQGMTVVEIARKRQLVESTIYAHVYALVVNKQISCAEVIPADDLKNIHDIFANFKKQPALKELKALLREKISYGEIRCAAFEYYNRKNN
ncbi:MAG: helix-turn-helix domain-containing protein [Nanoarchaeota archaeon]|nr:helix-turn-helix domain-containing protein [Nanoarchaeota archaeon]